MATVLESSQSPQELASGLQLGVNTLSGNQTLLFVLYRRIVLPIDGFVFWLNCVNSPPSPLPASPLTFNFQGSLHYAQDTRQETDATYAVQNVRFTALQKIDEFAAIAPDLLYITTLANGTKLAFNGQTGRYDQAGLWHYAGRALLGVQASQIVEHSTDIDVTAQIVSNSLPFWLAMGTTQIPVYPSFLSRLNIHPPYVTADITDTDGIGQSPIYDATDGQSQLTMENVKFTFYGLNNSQVLTFQKAVLDNSLNGDYGISNSPVPVDEKLAQSEFNIIAQKKTMILKTNYYQQAVREITRKLIFNAGISINRPLPSWVQRTSPLKYWSACASSADGEKLVAADNNYLASGQIWTSDNSGITWTQSSSPRAIWASISSSSNGSKVIAVDANFGHIWTSIDYGDTWTSRASQKYWSYCASSYDGVKLVAVTSGGYVWTSTDSGINWTQRASSLNWSSCASSFDGTKLAATVSGGGIWTSIDSGVTWNEQSSINSDWRSIASSYDGSKLVAVTYAGYVWTSIDSGVTWIQRATVQNWKSCASSANGEKLIAVVYGGYIWISDDSGIIWTQNAASLNWNACASSENGSKFIAVVDNGYIWTYS
jgi:hypothetical protein